MSILYNPIDTSLLKPSPQARARMRESLAMTDTEVVIGYVGRMVADKGIFVLFDASERVLAQAPDTRMLWVGDGVDLAALRARVERSAQRSRHTFVSWTADVHGVYASLDIAVVPSQYPDPCPRVPVEAQACGVPVVCSDAGGLPETFIPNVSGLLAEPGDAGSLSNAILNLASDADRRRNMGVAGREWVCSKLSFERIAQDFEALLADPRPRGAEHARPETPAR
jgi:glycosyltransferase involved in cell wall biosynthesis